MRRISRPPRLLRQTRTRTYTSSRPPGLLRQIPPRLHAYSAPPELLRQRGKHLHVRLYAGNAPLEFRGSYLFTLHIDTPAAHFQTLHLHIYTPTAHLQTSFEANTSLPQSAAHLQTSFEATSPGPQHASRALETNTSTSPGLQHDARGTRSLVANPSFWPKQKLKGEGAYKTFRSSRHCRNDFWSKIRVTPLRLQRVLKHNVWMFDHHGHG